MRSGSSILNDNVENLVAFMYFLADESAITISYANCKHTSILTTLLAFLEDLYDCLSLGELQNFYAFMSKKLLKFKIIFERTNHTWLKICNSMLRRISKSTHNNLRGK